jgi:hypothetical protein
VYTVTVTDASGCTRTATATVTVNPLPTVNIAKVDATCGLANGSATANVSGGTMPYGFAWTHGPTTASITGLNAGTYTVVVTDANGCTASDTETIINIGGPTLSVQSTNVNCFGGNNGAINLTATSGTAPFNYDWGHIAGSNNSKDLNNLIAGTYCVTVTDANSCATSTCVTITQPTEILNTFTVTNLLCNDVNTGAIDLSVTGGVSPYTYDWSNDGDDITDNDPQDLSGLAAGTYTVTVTDFTGCTKVTSITLTQPNPILITVVSKSDVTCNGGNDGSVDVSVSGGSGLNYAYNWSDNSQSQDLSGVPAGTYCLTVTDGNNCTKSVCVTILEPTALQLTLVPTNVTCNDGNNGAVNLTVTGGTPGYTYAWSNNQTAQDLSGLTAGEYCVTVTDANDCTATSCVTITEPTAIIANATATDVACNGGNNGTVTLTVSGGTGAYNFDWAHIAGTNNPQNLSNLTAGTYTVTVTDANGCTTATSATVDENATLDATLTSTNVLCNGGNNGSITVVVNGGTTPYSFDWGHIAGTNNPQNLSNLVAGTYTVTIRDANSCSIVRSSTVGQPTVLVATATVANVSCNGGENGAINLSVSGGTPDYGYQWSANAGSATTEDVSGLSAGTYTVTVTDANGCSTTLVRTVTQPTVLQPTATVTNVDCFGNSTGAIDLTVTGGTAQYTYMWMPGGAITQDLTNRTAGTYTVTITDANGCTAVLSRTITEPPALDVQFTTEPVTACAGGSDGSIDLTVTGGTPGYTYTWSGSSVVTQDRTGLAAGTYTVTVRDSKGCTAVRVITVEQLSGLDLTLTPTSPTCENGTNGSVTLQISGGSGGYIFDWAHIPGTNNPQNLTNVAAGNYAVTVTDQDGCTAAASTTVVNPVIVIGVQTTPVTCNGGNDGTIDLTVSGGTAPYTYNWGGGIVSEDRSGVTAGTYMVTVTDANGCSKTRSVTVSQPTALTLSIAQSPVACNGASNGSLNLTVSGGTPGYTFQWSGNAGTVEDPIGLAAGTYTVTVTDANGCTRTASATLTQPPALSLTAVPVRLACPNSSTGSIALTVTGGTPGYTFLWSSGSNAQNPSNLAAGTYTVTVTDANGCTATTSATVLNSPEIVLTTSVTNVLCNGTSTGSIDLTVTGGVPDYAYIWSGGNGTNQDLTNRPAGTYTVTVTDMNGCTKTASATITQPPVISLSATTTKPDCFGGNNGSINLTVTGGTPGYTYQWSANANGQTIQDPINLTAGTYTVTVTDANACTRTLTATITAPPALTANLNVFSPDCDDNGTGSILAIPQGGTAPYTYAWSNGAATPGIGNVVGTFTVTVTDSKGCSVVRQGTVNAYNSPTLTATTTHVTCNGGENGAINLTVTGGSAPFQYTWNGPGPFFATSQDLDELRAGTYTVTVIDANGCSATLFRVVGQPNALNLSTTVVGAGCGGNTGSIDLTVGGGVPPYTYAWSTGASTQDISGLTAGTYTVTVTDANSCTKTASATVTGGNGNISATASSTPTTCGASNGTITIDVTGGTGPYTWTGANTGGPISEPFIIGGLASGNYVVTITDANGCSTTVSATVPQSNPISATATATATNCGASNGSITVDVTGGSAPYTWTGIGNGGSAQNEPFTVNNLAAGNYCLTITSANGCTATVCATVPQSTVISATATATATSCGASNGSITVDVTGGSAPYTWTGIGNGGSAQSEPFTVNNLAAGNYCLTITSANGCTATVCATVPQSNPISATASSTPVTCFGGANGTITVDVTNGTPNYSYTWTNGTANGSGGPINGEPFTITNLVAGTYTVTVTSGSGCTAVVSTTVGQPAQFTATATASPTTCNAPTATISVDITGGGAAPYTWNGGTLGTGNSFTEPFTIQNVGAGQYCITITNANGCTTTACVTVQQAAGITASATPSPATCGDNNGTITIDVTGGSQPYSYQWNNGSGTPGNGSGITTEPFTISGLGAGMYNITVTSGNGCTAVVSATVNQTSAIGVSATAQAVGCNGQGGKINITVVNGSPAYSYNWTNTTNGAQGQGSGIGTAAFMIQNLAAGSYNVTVKDGNNCMGMATVVVPQATNITATATTTPAACGANTGTITVDVVGGTAPYTWSGAGTGTAQTEPFTISGLAGGTYTVTVTDANGCSATVTATVQQSTALTAAATATGTNCGAANGSVTVTVSSGTAPYTWVGANTSGTAQGNSFTVGNLPAGNYCFTITSANGCTGTACATVAQSNAIGVTASVVPTPCGITASTAMVTVTGAALPLSYNWVNTTTGATGQLSGVNSANFVITNLAAGNIAITVTGANGCTANTSVTVVQFQALQISATATAPGCGASNGSVTINVTAGGNTQPYAWSWTLVGGVGGPTTGSGTAQSAPFTVSGLAPGIYNFVVNNAFNCSATTTVVVPPGGAGGLDLTVTHVCAPTCSGTNGEFGITVEGGSSPFSYAWAGPANTSGTGISSAADTVRITGLTPGNYTITVTDANGCSATTTAAMLPPTTMFVAAVPTCATVCGGNDGKITVGVLFGTPNYTYQWAHDGGATGTGTANTNEFVIGGLTEGAYTITVTGSDGCTQVVSTTVVPISSITATAITSGAAGCDGAATACIIVNATSGTPGFSYNWSNGSATGSGSAAGSMFNICDVPAGNYSITLTDANGCTGVVTASIGGNIGGVVFNDYNTDGSMAAGEPGLDSVLVYLYACNNPLPVDSAWTDANGAYAFQNLGNFPYRVEFVPVADSCWIKPAFAGVQSGTTVQFIETANCDLKVGFFYPGDYCQDEPDIAYSCFAQGKTDEVTSTVIGLVPYDAIDRSEIFGSVEANELVGSVYGLAYDRTRHLLYASAFLKRHVGLGTLGLGGIYRIDYSNISNPTVQTLYTVPNVGSVVRPADLGAPNAPSMDTDAFGKIGKVGLGDIDISDDENTLWTINLNTRKLVRIDNVLGNAPVTSTELTITSAPNCDNGLFRPLAVKANRNKIYVGGVCTGENSGATADDLSASVHEYNVKTGTWKMILNWDLHAPQYNHGDIVGSVNQNLAQCKEWETWVDVYTERNLVANTGSGEPSNIFNGNFEIVGGGPTGAEFRCRGQALVSDIEITREGMMVIAMMDRTGHQFGYRQHRPTTDQGNPISASPGGDILAAYPVNGVWTLESNGTVPGLNRTSLFGPNSGDGINGGEFFYDNTRFTHLDADCGGLLYVPGKAELLGAINNPNTSEYNFGGGIVYYDLLDGNTTRNDLTLLDPTANTVGIGMANSIGDLEAMCDPAPIQIGNYVWNDLNADGIQDACEDPIPGVLVSLYDATTSSLLAHTVTNAKGAYYFTGIGTPGENWVSTPGYDSIRPTTAYRIVFGTNGTTNQFNTAIGKLVVSGTEYELTLPNVGAGWYKDWNDSDATIANNAGKPWNGFPTIAYTTGMAGCTDHTLDAGFVSENLGTLTACAIESGSNLGLFDLTAANNSVNPGGQGTVSYHLTAANAQSGQGMLSSPYVGADGAVLYARVQATNGTVTVVAVTLQVDPLPTAYVGQLKVCPDVFDGMMGTFTLSNANAQVTGGVAGLTVSYHDSEAEAAQGINALPNSYNAATSHIWARVQNAAGCYDVDLLQLVVVSSPGVALTVSDNTCTGSAAGSILATMTDGPANYTYTWSTGLVTGPTTATTATLGNLNAGVYTVTVKDGNGCTVTASAEVEDGIQFSIVPIPDYGPINAGTQIGPIVLQTTTWGADFSWTGGTSVGLANGTATSLFPLIMPFNATAGTATITVTATLGACSDTEQFTITVVNQAGGNGEFSVAGLVVTEQGDAVEETAVSMIAQGAYGEAMEADYLTDFDGSYLYEQMLPDGADYTVTPLKDDNPANGVTTFDLVMIEKHILAIEPLNSPYKLIAADANRSGSITTFDIIAIRKLILGISTDFPNNTSWRFVDQGYVFPNPSNPFQEMFPENISYTNITEDRSSDHFIGVKIGDVNNSAIANSHMGTEARGQGSILFFDVEDRLVKAGEEFSVEFESAEAVRGYQFTLNTRDLEVLEVLPGNEMDETNFAVFRAKNAVTTSWSAGGKAKFALKFRAKANGNLRDMLEATSAITRAEAYGLDETPMQVGLRFNAANGSATLTAPVFELYQNQPNPFTDRTVIGFFLPEASAATLTIFDEAGRMIHMQKGDYAKGYNAITLEAEQLGSAAGQLHYRLSTPTDAAARKMIRVRK